MSTRFTNAVVHDTFEPAHTYQNEDGTESVAIPPHVSTKRIFRHALST